MPLSLLLSSRPLRQARAAAPHLLAKKSVPDNQLVWSFLAGPSTPRGLINTGFSQIWHSLFHTRWTHRTACGMYTDLGPVLGHTCILCTLCTFRAHCAHCAPVVTLFILCTQFTLCTYEHAVTPLCTLYTLCTSEHNEHTVSLCTLHHQETKVCTSVHKQIPPCNHAPSRALVPDSSRAWSAQANILPM